LLEIRKDYFTHRLVIVAPDRSKTPGDLLSPPSSNGSCSFCPGNEDSTPPANLVLVSKEGSLRKLTDTEDERVRDWAVRVFPNTHPVVIPNPTPSYNDSPLYSEPAAGYDLVLVATPNHNESFSKMPVDQWINILTALQDRVRWLYSRKSVSYVNVFINSGREAGGNLTHPHAQIVTLPRLPPLIEDEALTVQESLAEEGICPMCLVLNTELGGPRQIIATEFYLGFCPWASANAFEFWIFPRRHQTSFLKITQKEISELALVLRASLGGLASLLNGPPFNLMFHLSSEKKTTRQLHWHIEVYPNSNTWGGLERGAGVFVNSVPPEQAAQLLSQKIRSELARLSDSL